LSQYLKNLLSQWNLDGVYNCDETTLYWKLEPSKTLANGPFSGTKRQKDKVIVLLTESYIPLNQGIGGFYFKTEFDAYDNKINQQIPVPKLTIFDAISFIAGAFDDPLSTNDYIEINSRLQKRDKLIDQETIERIQERRRLKITKLKFLKLKRTMD
ncbi:3582_t:CDS:2, partial [Entrophospora sp. SA101]